jgi:hypothetical protein
LRPFVLLAFAVALLPATILPAASSFAVGAQSSETPHDRLLLAAKRLRPGGARFEVKVRLDPCRDRGGLPVQLSRNGKSFASKHLDDHCRGRFWLTVAKVTPIRAFVRLGEEDERLGSRQRKLRPPKRG